MASQPIPGFSWHPASTSQRRFAQIGFVVGAWLALAVLAAPLAGCVFVIVTGSPADQFLALLLCNPCGAVLVAVLACTPLMPVATGRVLCSYVSPASSIQLDGVRDLLGKVPQGVAVAMAERMPNPELMSDHDVRTLEVAVALYLRGIETASTLREAVRKLSAEIGRHQLSRGVAGAGDGR